MSIRKLSLLLVVLILLAAGVLFLLPGGLFRRNEGGATGTIYACPMVEDAEVRSDRPGRCPKCGMDLVPLAETPHAGMVHATAPATTAAAQDHAGHGAPVATAPAATGAQTWYCPMHPTYIQDRPGTCPICNMNLVPLQKGDDATASAIEGRAIVRIRPDRQQLIGVRFGTAARKPIAKTIRAVGRVDYDERRLGAVSLKFGGWIEELHVKATGQLVRKGDPLFVIYSPELLEAQRSYLLARESAAAAAAQTQGSAHSFARESLRSARDRLLLWDLTEEQIDRLATKGEPETRVTMLSKVQGVVTSRNIVAGAAVMAASTLYEIADLESVWVYADVYEYELREVRIGQRATVTLETRPGESFTGTVAYVYPYLNEQTRTIRVRLEVPNPDGVLLPGLYGTVALAVDLGERLVVDDGAIVHTGTRTIVFLDRGEGRFEPREVTLGPRVGGLALIDKGLQAGDRVVTSGTFLIDSESRLKSALISGTQTPDAGHAGHERK